MKLQRLMLNGLHAQRPRSDPLQRVIGRFEVELHWLIFGTQSRILLLIC